MFGYVVRRIISGLLVLFVVSVSVFALFFYGPSDPAYAYCPESHCTPARLQTIRETLQLNRPVVDQYASYMKGIFAGNDYRAGALTIACPAPCLGVSFKLRLNVTDYLLGRFPATLALAVGSALLFLPIGVGMGVLAARVRGTLSDKAIVGSSLFLSSIPYYLLALLAYLYLVSKWAIFPETGYFSPFTDGPLKFIGGLLLPWLVLALWDSTQYARFSRGSMIDALNEDYVRTARSKGLSERRVTLKHALRAAIVPVITIFGLDFAYLLAGTVFTEYIFNIQGIGMTAISAIFQQDLPVIMATVLIYAVFVVATNLIVDIVYSLIDPRVRLS